MDIEKLKRRKKALNLTNAEIADKANIPLSTVKKVFTGETKAPSYVTLEAITNVIVKAEAYNRIVRYYEALYAYMAEHQNENDVEVTFEKMYREENNLTDMPIRFAVPRGTENEYADSMNLTNLALKKEYLIDIKEYYVMDTGERDELIKGKIIYNQAPSRVHQDFVRLIAKAIDKFIDANNGKCIVYDGGINVELDEFTNLIPDIAVICDRLKLTDMGIKGGPDLVIEVTSPSTIKRDYKEKTCAYLLGNVLEYWVVDLQRKKVAVYLQGEPFVTKVYDFSDYIPVGIYDGKLKICVNELLGTNQ